MDVIHLFIDTSTFLTFYAYTSDNLEELKKVSDLIGAGKLKLYIPEQVSDEFQRNREGKLAQSLTEFLRGGIAQAVPRFMAEYPEAVDFTDAGKAYEQARAKLEKKARKDAAEQLLPADSVFTTIIDAAGLIKSEEEILQKANRRRLRGNPPGKKDSVGDQINWEILLDKVPDGQDLHVVTKDGDYASALNSDSPHQFLQTEWKKKKNGSLFIHRQLKPFLNAKFSDIKLVLDIEKQLAIDSLIYSGNFSRTHSAIDELKQYLEDLIWKEAEQIFEAGISNQQISWIGTDTDVNDFYRTLMIKFRGNMTSDMETKLKKVFLAPIEIDDDDDDNSDVPF